MEEEEAVDPSTVLSDVVDDGSIRFHDIHDDDNDEEENKTHKDDNKELHKTFFLCLHTLMSSSYNPWKT